MLRRTISRTTWLTQNPYRLAPLVYKLSYNPPPPATPSSPAVPEQPAPPPPASTRASTNSSTGPFSSSLAKAPTTTPKKESAPKAAPKPSAYRLDRPETSELPFRHSSEHLADINYELVTQGERIDKAEKSLKKLVKSEERKIEELARIVEVLQESREGQWERRAKSFGWPLLVFGLLTPATILAWFTAGSFFYYRLISPPPSAISPPPPPPSSPTSELDSVK